MRLIILLSVVTWSSCAKLDRTYLPPSYAQTSGGNGNFLQTPVARPQEYQQNGFAQNKRPTGANNYVQNYQQNEEFAPSGNDYEQKGNIAQDNSFQQNDEYNQNGNSDFAQNGNAGFNGFNDFESRPERPQAAFERNAAILRQDTSNDGETYSYAYETENGITAEENGIATNGVEAQGGYSYTGDDGQVYSVRYTADQNGFQPVGDHLPTPPPIPEEILKALEQNARDEANGIFDDGTYNEGKYDAANGNSGNFDGSNGYNYNNNGNNLNNGADNFNSGTDQFNNGADFNGNSNSFNAGNNNDDSIETSNALLRSSNEASRFGNQNQVNKAYLPPFERNGQRTQAVASRYPQNNGFRSQPAAFNNQASNGFSDGLEKAYLPPQQFGMRSQNGARRNQPSAFGRQTSNNIQRNGGSRSNASNGVNKAYLPPFESDPNAPSTIYDQPQSFGQRSQNSNVRNGANRIYLPPSANQRNNGRTSPRRPTFSARNGYQY